ncbi:pyridoxamine 5'-phosphate oxidase [Okeania hirsuta]|nr:pyridoxamine 5'-phosphate oxidase [Okeania hirsuta]
MSISNKLPDMRLDYGKDQLDESMVDPNPFQQFENWFKQADEGKVKEANAMILATVSEEGLFFYTNYESRKGKELAENPLAAVTFFWESMERQIRIEGKVEKASPENSDHYFQQRGRGSRIGAWASPQSQVIADRSVLEERVKAFEEKFAEEETFPRPEYWGGYKLIPDYFEFWQGRKSRLHDRIIYQKEGDNWKLGRIAP